MIKLVYLCYYCKEEREIEFGKRPKTLPDCYRWPGEDGFIDMPLHCDCGEIMNVKEQDVDDFRFKE